MFKKYIRSSLAARLLAIVFGIYFIITLSVTLAHIAAEYIDAKKGIVEDLKTYQSIFESPIGDAIWNFDKIQLQSIMEGIQKVPSIIGVKIETLDKESIFDGIGIISKKDDNVFHNSEQFDQLKSAVLSEQTGIFSHSFDVRYNYEGNSQTIAKATFYSSSSIVIEKVKLGLVFILVNSIIKTSVLWFIFLWVSRSMLSKPLASLTEAARQLDLDNLENLNISINVKGRTELNVLEEAFKGMVAKLIASHNRMAALRSFHQTLGRLQDGSAILNAAFEELNRQLEVTDCVLYFGLKEDQFQQQRLAKNLVDFLKKLPTKIWGKSLFKFNQQVAVYNNINVGSEIHHFYGKQSNYTIENGHFLFVMVPVEYDNLICLYRSPNQPIFDRNDVEFVTSLTEEITNARSNIKAISQYSRMQQELETAKAVQTALLPKQLPNSDRITLATHFKSASEIGGDWYGFLPTNKNSLFVFIGDVTGHGTPAALVAATASSVCGVFEEMLKTSSHIPQELTPASMLNLMNTAVYKTGAPKYLMTFFIAHINMDSGEVVFANAGHNFPILMRKNGHVIRLLSKGNRLGDIGDYEYVFDKISLGSGDHLLFYTDGIIENENTNQEVIGERGLVKILNRSKDESTDKMMDNITSEVYGFLGETPIEDDMTLVLVKIK